MKKFFRIDWRDDSGFTLVEMLIVLLVVSVLLLLTIPNIVSQSESINDKGCEAFVTLVEGQVQAYQLEYKKNPTLNDLLNAGYLSEDQKSCPNGKKVEIESSGKVHVK